MEFTVHLYLTALSFKAVTFSGLLLDADSDVSNDLVHAVLSLLVFIISLYLLQLYTTGEHLVK